MKRVCVCVFVGVHMSGCVCVYACVFGVRSMVCLFVCVCLVCCMCLIVDVYVFVCVWC